MQNKEEGNMHKNIKMSIGMFKTMEIIHQPSPNISS